MLQGQGPNQPEPDSEFKQPAVGSFLNSGLNRPPASLSENAAGTLTLLAAPEEPPAADSESKAGPASGIRSRLRVAAFLRKQPPESVPPAGHVQRPGH
jgi:hypothetical protein